jgi:two-component system LytT family response regulator/two-component system response regulator LytT
VTELRTVIVDDEPLARNELRYLLGRVGGVDVVGEAGDGVAALETLERLNPDLVLLDVQMPGLSGFEVARRLVELEQPAQIIFVTAYDRFAIDAFDVNAVDYLLKPVDSSRLEVALERARRRIGLDRSAARPPLVSDTAGEPTAEGLAAAGIDAHQLERIVQLVADRQSRRERLAIRVGERFLLVQAEEIVYASLAEDSIRIVTGQHAGTSNYRSLDELQARLDPSIFWRVHRAHLVNINKIKEIVPWFSRNYILRMKDEKATEIPVSRAQTRRLREYLKL